MDILDWLYLAAGLLAIGVIVGIIAADITDTFRKYR